MAVKSLYSQTESCNPPSRLIDLTGKQFHEWTAVKYAGARKWECVCSCGTRKIISGHNLRNGSSKSCGCRKNPGCPTHGLSRTREYNMWCNMKARCYNENRADYKHYGGRGIAVCERWRYDFEAFLEDMGKCPDGMTLERKDVNGDYCKANCCFESRRTQANNTRRNRPIKYRDETKN